MSGNKDARKIYKTVINAIHLFLENNSGAIIVFKGSDRKRHQLYHRILVKFYDEISSEFELLGDTLDNEVVPFEGSGIYSQYQIKKKNIMNIAQNTKKRPSPKALALIARMKKGEILIGRKKYFESNIIHSRREGKEFLENNKEATMVDFFKKVADWVHTDFKKEELQEFYGSMFEVWQKSQEQQVSKNQKT